MCRLLLIALLAWPAGVAAAEQPPAASVFTGAEADRPTDDPLLAPGRRVRVYTERGSASQLLALPYAQGRLLATAPDSLWLSSEVDSSLMAFPLDAVHRLDVQAGKTRASSTIVGLILGTLAGTVTGAATVLLLDRDGPDDDGIAYAGLSLIPIGAIAGMTVGAVRGRDRWERVW